MANRFAAGDWIERLANLLPTLAQVQKPYLHEYQERCASVIVLKDGEPPPFPLDDLRLLYDEVRNSRLRGMEAHYEPLRAVLDPVRHALLSHPTLERVAVTGRLIGDNDFWMQILGSGSQISPGVLIAGLMARAAELRGDRFRTALGELNEFLSPAGNGATADVLGNLDEGCDVLLFYGLSLSEVIEVADGMALLPYGEVLRFVDQELVEKFAPWGAGIYGWRSVGAVVRRFRWRPEFRRRGRVNEPAGPPPPPFFQEAAGFLDLLAVSHTTRITRLAALSNRIDGSVGRFLGRETQSLGLYQSWSAEGFSGFDVCPALRAEAFEESREAFGKRNSVCFAKMEPVVGRLSEALRRDGRFAFGDGILDVAIALERMYVLDERNIGYKLSNRASRYLETDPISQERTKKNMQEFYKTRSDIVHSRLDNMTPERVRMAFDTGFEIARRSLFKMVREGRPRDWNTTVDAGS